MTITRRATLAVLAASPISMASSTLTPNSASQGQTRLAKLFSDWQSAIRKAEYLSSEGRHDEAERTFDTALDIHDQIASEPCADGQDVWRKLHVALHDFPDAPDDNILLSLKSDAAEAVAT